MREIRRWLELVTCVFNEEDVPWIAFGVFASSRGTRAVPAPELQARRCRTSEPRLLERCGGEGQAER